MLYDKPTLIPKSSWVIPASRRRRADTIGPAPKGSYIGYLQRNGMDAPTLNGIKRAKVEVSATT